jgi:uncharacterized protein
MTEPLERLDEADLGRKGITGYRPGGFRVGKTWHDGHLLLLPTGVASWPIETIDDVSEESLAPLRDLQPPAEILLLGLGTKAPLVAFELRQALADWGLSVEAMPTPSACRTFNVLLAEERRVVAALLAMP